MDPTHNFDALCTGAYQRGVFGEAKGKGKTGKGKSLPFDREANLDEIWDRALPYLGHMQFESFLYACDCIRRGEHRSLLPIYSVRWPGG